MTYEKIYAPINAKYLSDFLTELPAGILNKKKTNCGATTIALEDEYPTIIAVPKKKLIKNKIT